MRPIATSSRTKLYDALIALALAGAGGGGTTADLPFVVARPIDGVQDDWPAFMGPGGVCAVAAAKAQAVIMLPGKNGEPWVCKTPNLQMPRNFTLIGTPLTVINQTLNPFGGVQSDAFTASTDITGTFALAANPVVGSETIHVTSGTYPIGSQIVAVTANTLVVQQFTVIAVSGTAPDISITVDRPILIDMTTVDGSVIQTVTNSPTNIRIIGNGMQMHGSGDGFVHLLYALGCEVSGLQLFGDPINLLAPFTYDTGSYNNDVSEINVFSGQSGFGLTGTELSRVSNCHVSNVAVSGYFCDDSLQCMFLNDTADTCGNNGIEFDGSVGNAVGSFLCVVQGGTYAGCLTGIAILNGSNRNRIIGATCTGNTSSGAKIAAGLRGTPADNTWIGVNCSNNPGDGFTVAPATPNQLTRTIAEGCQADDNGAGVNFDINVSADTKWLGLSCRHTSTGPTQAVNIEIAQGDHKFIGCHIENKADNGQLFVITGGEVSVVDTELTLDGTSAPIAFQLLNSTRLSIEDVLLNGTGTVVGVNGNTGTTTRLGHRVNLSSKAGVFAIQIAQPGAFINKSFAAGTVSSGPPPFTATGTTPVVVAFPTIRLEDSVFIELTTGGTVAAGIAPGTIVKNPGTGFTYTGSAAGDLGVYEWRIIG